MFNLSTYCLKVLFNTFLIASVLIVFYYTFLANRNINQNTDIDNARQLKLVANLPQYNVWLIFTKVNERSPLRYKFNNILVNLLTTSSVRLSFHIIVDNSSRAVAAKEISEAVLLTDKNVSYSFYDVEECAESIEDIVSVMTPRFSSKPGIYRLLVVADDFPNFLLLVFSGTYYSDALFYLSLGLYRIAPKNQKKAVLLDCDLFFKQDVKLLFKEFDR